MGSSSGTSQSMTVNVGAVGTSTHNNYQMAIYSDVNGLPGSLIGTTAAGTLVPNSWNTLPITVALQANASYWLAYNTHGNSDVLNDMYYADVATNQGAFSGSSVNYGSWPPAFPNPVLGGWEVSIYITYQ